MRAIELAVSARLCLAGKLADQRDVSKTGCDAQVARLDAEQIDDFPVAPEQRGDERCAAIPARREIGARAGVEHDLRELRRFE